MNIFRIIAASAILVSMGVLSASADTVKMRDGRQFEGTVTHKDDETVTLQSVKDGITTELKIQMSQVEKVDIKPTADNPLGVARTYVKPPPKAGKYVEIPIVGRIGEQTLAEGMAGTLAKASEDSVEHVVFYVDSQGGDLDATRKIRELMQSFKDRLKFHAVVRDAVGTAMAIPMLCQDVYILPGATMGGTMLTFDVDKLPSGKTEQLMRSEVAMNAARAARQRGQNESVIRAMFDPDYHVVLWLDKKGVLQATTSPPSGNDLGKIIYQSDGKKVLMASRDETIELGLGKAFSGTIDQLGSPLGIANWSKYNDSGERNMQAAADKVRANQVKAGAAAGQKTQKAEQDTHNLSERREQLKSYIASNLAEAAQWDPSKDMMEYTKWASAGDGESRVYTTPGGATNIYTDKADVAIMALYKAMQGVDEMIGLEKQAAAIGLKPLYKPGELDQMRQQIVIKGTFLEKQRSTMSQIVRF
ncbi:MAG: hypothetical protein HZA50_02230 [Planctomycetes bacterium]|nr:hypothetical protein [Planctomycetota bacterium]